MRYGRVLVVCQVLLLLGLGANASFIGLQGVRMVLLALALAVGVAAVVAMRFRFSIFPVAESVNQVVDWGIYRFIRHPMYLALMLAGVSVCPTHRWFAWAHFILLACLGMVLREKMKLEEAALSAKFPGYREYSNRTKRLIPFLW